jgi:hypothetical protein
VSKGSYLGGSTVIGGGHSWHVEPRSPADQERDRLEEMARKAALKARKRIPQTPKAERRAENEARKKFSEASKDVIVEHMIDGEIVSTRTIQRS